MLGQSSAPARRHEALAVGEKKIIGAADLAAFLESEGVSGRVAFNGSEPSSTDACVRHAGRGHGGKREKGGPGGLGSRWGTGFCPWSPESWRQPAEGGRPTTARRGGADFSAAILGCGARTPAELWIWNRRVERIMTADHAWYRSASY